MRRSKLKWVVGLAVLLLMGATLVCHRHREAEKYSRLRADLHAIQLQIERYAADHEGDYPKDVAAVLSEYHAKLPPNPYGAGKVTILKPGDRWCPGGIVYIGVSPILGAANSVEEARKRLRHMEPKSVDRYWLLGYTPRKFRQNQEMKQTVYDWNGSADDIASEIPRLLIPLTEPDAVEKVEWEHVAMFAMNGDDHIYDRSKMPNCGE